MKINKVDDKPMVIHTKKNSELHIRKGKHTDIRKTEARDFRDINTPNRKSVITRPKPKGNTINQNRGIMAKAQERAERMKSHISTSKTGKGIGVSVKSLHAAGAETALGQVEGGEEIRDAAHVAQTIYRPATGISSKGAELAKQQAVQAAKKRIKKVNAGKRLAKSGARETAKTAAKETVKQTAKIAAKESAKFAAEVAAETGAAAAGTVAGAETGAAAPLVGMVVGKAVGEKVAYELDKADVKMTARTRKIRFFVDKMKDKEDQQDSVWKLARDLTLNKLRIPAKRIAKLILGALLMLVMLITAISIPVVGVLEVLYNSPFAYFMPSLEDGETVSKVASAYVAEFNQKVKEIADAHEGADSGKIIHAGSVASNLNDIVAVYMVKYGVGDTATVMNDTSKTRLKRVVDDMCSYTTTTKNIMVTDSHGRRKKQKILCVNVTLKTYTDMIAEYQFDDNRKALVEQMMTMFGTSTSVTAQSALTQSEVDDFVKDIKNPKQKAAVTFALTRVGYPYSMELRHSGKAYDCSSLVYYAWLAAGVDVSYEGMSTASWEGRGLAEAGKSVSFVDIQPGDLIFYSYENNGCYLNISHVAIYVGNGMIVEARNEEYGVIMREVPNIGSIVMIGRP